LALALSRAVDPILDLMEIADSDARKLKKIKSVELYYDGAAFLVE
jgi:hypothetical protein